MDLIYDCKNKLDEVKGRSFGSPLTRGLKPRASTAENDTPDDTSGVCTAVTICEKRNKFRGFENLNLVACKKCGHKQDIVVSESLKKDQLLDQCPVCQKKDFYTQRDFPQQAGCLVVLIGACLVPWTYGLSLAVVAIIDFILYRLLSNISVCYHCLSRIRGTQPNTKHKSFDHNLFEYFLKEEEKKK